MFALFARSTLLVILTLPSLALAQTPDAASAQPLPPALTNEAAPTGAETPTQERVILYYKDPMGGPDTSAEPKKDSMGMDYIPVYADEEAAEPAEQAPTEPAPTK